MSAPIGAEQKILSWVKSIFAEKEMTFQKQFLNMLAELDGAKWELLEEMMQKTMGGFPNQSLPQEKTTAADAEAAYIKSRSKNVPNAASPVSNITTDAGSSANCRKLMN